MNSSGIDIAYPPENTTEKSEVFDAQSNGLSWWSKVDEIDEVYQFFSNHMEYGNGIHYAQTFLKSDKNQTVIFKLGKSGPIRVWLNDVLVIEDDNDHITEMDALNYKVNLQEGVNRVLVKLASSSSPYFILRIEDEYGNKAENITATLSDRKYKKGSASIVNVEKLTHEVEEFFKKNSKNQSKDLNLNRLLLYYTYLRNGKIDEAQELINKWVKEYPNSSFLKICLIECYNKNGDTSAAKKIEDNIIRLDPDYYFSSMLKFQDFEALLKLDIETYERELNKIGNSIDYSYMKIATELLINLRRNNRDEIRKSLDKLLIDETLPSTIKTTFTDFYTKILKDEDTTVKTLEGFYAKEFNYEVLQYLAYYYKKQNRTEEAIKLHEDILNVLSYDNNVYYELISLLHDSAQYKNH